MDMLLPWWLPKKREVEAVESIVERSAVGMAEKHGWEVRKVQFIGRRGAPDRLFMKPAEGLIPGRSVWIEFKDLGKEARENQERQHAIMRAAGMEVHVCDNLRDAMMVLGIKIGK
jgi:hypothetical protein